MGGRGYYQEWGKEPVELNPGDVVYVAPETKHWHGAAPDSDFAHIAIMNVVFGFERMARAGRSRIRRAALH
ncbi:cupin domain-containing protein [Bifidobacterium breve]|uniref:hypothetical protein n=1 Tax=Bifidobacterium breve TaxID=1685 RepID=UPI00374EACD5